MHRQLEFSSRSQGNFPVDHLPAPRECERGMGGRQCEEPREKLGSSSR